MALTLFEEGSPKPLGRSVQLDQLLYFFAEKTPCHRVLVVSGYISYGALGVG